MLLSGPLLERIIIQDSKFAIKLANRGNRAYLYSPSWGRDEYQEVTNRGMVVQLSQIQISSRSVHILAFCKIYTIRFSSERTKEEKLVTKCPIRRCQKLGRT